MLNIEIKTIIDKLQRYNTVGDYWNEKEKIVMRVSDMNNWKFEILTAIHEMVEKFLCKAHGVSDDAITSFDIQYEANRRKDVSDEPGNDPSAPYYKEHQFATKLEKLFAEELGVDWKEYEKIITKLDSS